MWRVVLSALILLTGCASSRHEKEADAPTQVVEHESHEHHGHRGSSDCESDNIGQDILDDVESGFISLFFQAIFDSIFHRDD